jgi:hypothetical protein
MFKVEQLHEQFVNSITRVVFVVYFLPVMIVKRTKSSAESLLYGLDLLNSD